MFVQHCIDKTTLDYEPDAFSRIDDSTIFLYKHPFKQLKMDGTSLYMPCGGRVLSPRSIGQIPARA